MNSVSSSAAGGLAASSALEAAAAGARAAQEGEPATDIRFCAIDDPTCEACQ
jgi:ribonucleoside-diphosphate reductase alpha chain